MARKAPRRTAQRIQEAALALFNRYGEFDVSTSQIAGALGISPGNLYYHYPAKDGLVNTLFEQYQQHRQTLTAYHNMPTQLLALYLQFLQKPPVWYYHRFHRLV